MSIEKAIRSGIRAKVSLKFGGDDRRTMKDLAIDMINASELSWKEIADGAYLSTPTIKKLAQEITQYPRYDTIERVFKYFEYEANMKPVKVSAKNQNKPKSHRK